MGLFDSLKFWDKTPNPSKKKSVTTSYTPLRFNNLGVLGGSFEVSQTAIDTAYRNSITIFTALDWKATKVSECPITVLKINNKSKAYDYFQYSRENSMRGRLKAIKYKSGVSEIEDYNDPLKAFLDNPHPTLSLKELTYIYVVSKNITGSSVEVVLKVEDILNGKKKVQRLAPLPSNFVTLKGGNLFNAPDSYLFTQGDSLQKEFLPSEVLHVRNAFNMDYNLNNLYTGQSQLQAGRNMIEIASLGESARGQQFKNGGASGILYEKISPEDYEVPDTGDIDEFQDRIDKKILGVDKLNKIVYLPREMGFQKIGDSVVDLAILENEKITNRSLCAMLGIDPVVIGINTESGMGNGGNMKEGLIKPYNDGVLPELYGREDVLNKIVCPMFGDNYRVQYDVLSYAPIAEQRLQFVKEVEPLGLLTKNEMRLDLGYDTLDNPMCDEIWDSTSKQPLSEFAINSMAGKNIENDGSY